MDRKNIPLILMLAAGALTCIITMLQDYDILSQMTILLVVLVVFYFLGSILKWTLDYFDNQNEKKRLAEEEAAEKEAMEEAGGEAEEEAQQT